MLCNLAPSPLSESPGYYVFCPSTHLDHGTPVWASSCWSPWDCGKSLSVPHKAVSSQLLPISLSFCLTTVLRVPLQIAENTYPCLWQCHCFVWTGVFQKLSGVIFIIQRVSLKSLRYIRLFFFLEWGDGSDNSSKYAHVDLRFCKRWTDSGKWGYRYEYEIGSDLVQKLGIKW